MDSNPTGCQEKTGFVILHKCNASADAQCGMCGKYMCRKHTHINAGTPVCGSCFKQAAPEEYKKVSRSRDRYPYYHGYNPYYYSHYSSQDHSLFNKHRAGAFHEDGEGS